MLGHRSLFVLTAVFSLTVAQTPVPARPTGMFIIIYIIVHLPAPPPPPLVGYIYQSSSNPEIVIEAFYDQ